jgi:hypothetical protein
MELGNLITVLLTGGGALAVLVGLLKMGSRDTRRSQSEPMQTTRHYKGRSYPVCTPGRGDCLTGYKADEYTRLQAQAAMTRSNADAFGALYEANREARAAAGRSGRGSREIADEPMPIPLTDKDLAFYLFADKD